MSCFSVRQIEQIENGESNSFYGAQVKFTAAKKVAELLKLKPEDAFDFSGIAQVPKLVEEEKLQEEIKASAADKQVNPEKESRQEKEKVEEKSIALATKLAEPKSEKSSTRKISESAVDYRVQSKAKADPKKKIILLLAVAAAVIFSFVNLRPLFFPEPVKEEVVIIQEVVPEPAPTNAPAEPVVDTKPGAPVATAAAPAVATANAPAAAPTTVSAECPAADASAMTYKPDAPKKAGDMVYLQSKTAQTVCVVDATGKTQNKTLEPGVGASIYGKPPFKVLTGGLNQVDLYYQGAKVRTGNTSNKTIVLESAEIIQPATPSTSTDSQLR